MKQIHIGEIIRQRRIELGMTQEELCEGICESPNLSRIENGKQTPSRSKLNALLSRLGLPGEKYYAMMSENELEIERLKADILDCNTRNLYAEGLKKIGQLLALTEDDDHITHQFVMRSRVLLGREENGSIVPYSTEEKLELLFCAIEMTIPNFDLDEIGRHWYSLDEMKIINQIGIVYGDNDQRRKAIDIYYQLMKYVKRRIVANSDNAPIISLVAYNYSLYLCLEKRYEEAYETAYWGWEHSVSWGRATNLGGFMYVLAESSYFMGKITFREKDDYRMICEINGMLVDDEVYAKKFSEEIIDRMCKRLSLVFIKHNANRHLYQPRVEPVWSDAVFNRCEYAPFVEAKRKAFEKTDGNNKIIYLEDGIYIRDSMYCIAWISIPSEEIKISEWLSKADDVVEFLMNEYYSALGTENIKSKFFHLFSIIEFCEKEYEEHNGSSRLFTDEEVGVIIEGVQKQIDTSKRAKVVSILKNDLARVNDIGRVEKLENILKWMGVETYGRFGSDRPIDKKLLSDLTKLRNKSFHGTKENTTDVEKKYADAVEVLLYIGEKILDFLMKNSYQNKINGTVLIRGKNSFRT